jgi:hypothetical protein
MGMHSKLAEKICEKFATDQGHFIEQIDDGSYRKRSGLVNNELIETQLRNCGSIAIYQRNIDLTIKWICFDFDILKANLVNEFRTRASNELVRALTGFCTQLDEMKIPYLLEFSGNRGYHIWVIFNEPTNYRTGYDIQQEILNKAGLEYDEKLIGIDLFPHTATPSGGIGSGVKMPLSKHKKSGHYSYLIPSVSEITTPKEYSELSLELMSNSLDILNGHQSTSKSSIEKKLGVFFDDYFIENTNQNRVRNIQVEKSEVNLDELLLHWNSNKCLSILASKIIERKTISHKERILLVGMLCNVYCNSKKHLGFHLLHEIFKTTNNYDEEITTKAINSLRNFNFPTQESIEGVLNVKFESNLKVGDLIRLCIPKYVAHTDARFDVSPQDIEITRVAEINYLFMNDEIQSKIIIEELDSKNNSELSSFISKFVSNETSYEYYRHSRNEGVKTRELITLGSNLRVATSCILKQISHFIDVKINNNSHGYQVNKGFSGGYIYKPWLYLWLKFISNINVALESPLGKNYYIVKTDIKSFYSSIPHDNLKRLLLGDGNKGISDKYSSLNEETKGSYKKCLDALFFLTEDIVGSRVGLPQGPAYARYFAEIYLDDIDNEFQSKLASGEITLYQRYVDDIFFITKTEENANKLLKELKERLSLMKLEVNNEKTTVSNISRFHDDFNAYRSQSKYTVDQVSKRYVMSSDRQKEMAIEEFVHLIQSDSCQDDLSFIFSHLSGVKELTHLKNEQVKPTIISGVGRGSLFKNIFNFILEMNDGWELIYDIELFNELQSEVLTSCVISAIEVNKSKSIQLKEFVEKIEGKLSYSDIVFEHLAYLKVFLNCNVKTNSIPTKYYISILESCSNIREAYIDDELMMQLNTSINEVKSLVTFTKVIYTISFNDKVSEKQINEISSLFYAKLSAEEDAGSLSGYLKSEIDPSTAYKFYYLICLFTISDKNKSTKLVESMWEFCIGIFNTYSNIYVKTPPVNWLSKLDLLSIDNGKANWVIASIVDGNLIRGLSDKYRFFEKYHNTLLVYLTLGNKKGNVDISVKLHELKGVSEFYNWLIDNENVSIFPHSNKKWFELNVIENGLICLKKNNNILLRKASHLVVNEVDSIMNHKDDEQIIPHSNDKLVSLKKKLSVKSLAQKIEFLLSIINKNKSGNLFPSIFCSERMFNESDSSFFSNDFSYHSRIIFEDECNNVTSYENNDSNFISCFFKSISSYDEKAKVINEKYLSNLLSGIDKEEFLIKFQSQIFDINCNETELDYDISLAATLYLCLSSMETITKIRFFTEQYSKFNKEFLDKHIYAVKSSMLLNKESPRDLIKTIITSLKLIIDGYSKSLAFYLYKDFEDYLKIIDDIIFNSELGGSGVTLSDFEINEISASPLSKQIKFNSAYFDFDDTKIINPLTHEISTFEIKHVNLFRSTEHTYTYQYKKSLYILSVDTSISSIFIDIEKRYQKIIFLDGSKCSYPNVAVENIEISSLTNFDSAVEVIQHHKDIEALEAEELLIGWLTRLPSKYHQPLTTLINAHEIMKTSELDKFISKTKELSDRGESLFLIKKVDDYNGTHRILFKDNDLGRSVASFSPLLINESTKEVNIIVDVIISGTQIIKALKYYLLGVKPEDGSNYFECNKRDHDLLLKKFGSINKINICTVIYTGSSILRIERELHEILNKKIKVEVINGKDISQNAFFGTTKKISEKEKISLRSLLLDNVSIKSLCEHLSYSGKVQIFNEVDLDEINLITRYRSLPKKHFKFLTYDLKINNNSSPFNRVMELFEKK